MPRKQRAHSNLVEDEEESEKFDKSLKFMCEQFDPESMGMDVWHLKFNMSLRLAQIKDKKMKRLLLIESLNVKVFETLLNTCKPRYVFELTFLELYRGRMRKATLA